MRADSMTVSIAPAQRAACAAAAGARCARALHVRARAQNKRTRARVATAARHMLLGFASGISDTGGQIFTRRLHGAAAGWPMKAACALVAVVGVLGGAAGMASNISLAAGH